MALTDIAAGRFSGLSTVTEAADAEPTRYVRRKPKTGLGSGETDWA